MSDRDVWDNAPLALAREGRSESRRCGACLGVFSRPLESDSTHRQVDDSVDCPVDAEVINVSKGNRWKRR